MTQRYQDKVSQWENSQEALGQLTDELQANLNLLDRSQQNVDRLNDQIGTLQEQVDALKQQVRKAVAEISTSIYSHHQKIFVFLCTA